MSKPHSPDADVDHMGTLELTRASTVNQPKQPSAWRHLQHVGAVVHAASLGARELTHLVAEIHGTFLRLPSPLNRDYQAQLAHAPFPYRIVAGAFDQVAQKTRHLTTQEVEAQEGWPLQAQAILNGVSGDKLADWGSTLAFSLSMRDADGRRIAPAQWAAASTRGHVLLIHGLCNSDQDWNNPVARQFTDHLQAAGYAVGWLRYNTGQTIFENGRALDAWLAQCLTHHSTPLQIIGYSMGGLLTRSACHWAQQHQHQWIQQLSHVVCMGTPHLGAPAERLGNMANGWLGLTPYTKPLARLGNIRSRGIKDLSHGWVTPDHSFSTLPTQTQVLLLAAALNDKHEDNLIGDGLVPVRSAFAEHRGQSLLTGQQVQRRLISPLAHIPMISDTRVFQEIWQWWQATHTTHSIAEVPKIGQV